MSINTVKIIKLVCIVVLCIIIVSQLNNKQNEYKFKISDEKKKILESQNIIAIIILKNNDFLALELKTKNNYIQLQTEKKFLKKEYTVRGVTDPIYQTGLVLPIRTPKSVFSKTALTNKNENIYEYNLKNEINFNESKDSDVSRHYLENIDDSVFNQFNTHKNDVNKKLHSLLNNNIKEIFVIDDQYNLDDIKNILFT